MKLNSLIKHRFIRQASTAKSMKGLTMIELLITMVILSIITAVAAPSFVTLFTDRSVINEANRLIASIQFTRSEAIKRNGAVVMGRLSNDAFTWTDGWEIYEDASADVGGSAYSAVDDTLVRTTQSSTAGLTILSNNPGNQWLAFRGNGMTSENAITVFHICNAGDAANGRRVTVNIAGRTATDDIPANQTCTPP